MELILSAALAGSAVWGAWAQWKSARAQEEAARQQAVALRQQRVRQRKARRLVRRETDRPEMRIAA